MTTRRRTSSPGSEAGLPAQPMRSTLPGRLLTAALVADEAAKAAAGRAERAEVQLRWSEYVIDLESRLTASMDSLPTRETISQVAFPEPDAWALVDLDTPDGMIRLAIVHPDPAKSEMAALLNTRWTPVEGDPLGLPAAKRAGKPVAITENMETVLLAAAHSRSNLDLLLAMGFEACLVVPIRTGEVIDGAITFVSAHPRLSYTAEEVAVGQQIARASAHALRSAQLFGLLEARRHAAEESTQSRIAALGRVTHELRTPLNAIGGYAELLEVGAHGALTSEQHRDVERIQWNQHYLLTLVTDILSYVRVDARRVDFDIVDVDLHRVTAEVASMLEPLFAKKRQRMEVAIPDAAVFGRGDATRISQIILNVLTNAQKYAPAETTIAARCGIEPPNAFVDIADAGDGIPVMRQEAIFEPFVQLAHDGKGEAGGLGLGLAIARELARGMDGDLTVRNAVNGGSVFRLTVPEGRHTTP